VAIPLKARIDYRYGEEEFLHKERIIVLPPIKTTFLVLIKMLMHRNAFSEKALIHNQQKLALAYLCIFLFNAFERKRVGGE
jgi:hypothetical protein